MHLAALDADPHAARVVSEGNRTDGPTWDMLDHLEGLKLDVSHSGQIRHMTFSILTSKE